MQTQFTASQTVAIPVSEEGISIEAYLQNPRRIIYGLTDASQVEMLNEDSFRFSLSPLSFLTLEIKPTADLRIWSPRAGRVRIQAIRCWLDGAEHLNKHFSMTMEGSLRTTRQGAKARKLGKESVVVRGKADLTVTVDLPLPFSLTPKPIVEAAGNALLSGILSTIQRRLKRQLLDDYQAWATQEAALNASR